MLVALQGPDDALATPDGLSLAAIGFAMAGTFLYVVHHLSNAKSCAYVQKDVVKHGSE